MLDTIGNPAVHADGVCLPVNTIHVSKALMVALCHLDVNRHPESTRMAVDSLSSYTTTSTHSEDLKLREYHKRKVNVCTPLTLGDNLNVAWYLKATGMRRTSIRYAPQTLPGLPDGSISEGVLLTWVNTRTHNHVSTLTVEPLVRGETPSNIPECIRPPYFAVEGKFMLCVALLLLFQWSKDQRFAGPTMRILQSHYFWLLRAIRPDYATEEYITTLVNMGAPDTILRGFRFTISKQVVNQPHGELETHYLWVNQELGADMQDDYYSYSFA